MNDQLFPDEKHFIAKKTRDPRFWGGMHEASFKDGSPFAVCQEVKRCRSLKIELPPWAMDELYRIANSILKLEKVKGNNYGEFLSELLKLTGDKIKSARKNRELLMHAFRTVQSIGIKNRNIIIDDLINLHEISENQAKRVYKWAKEIKNFSSFFPQTLLKTHLNK